MKLAVINEQLVQNVLKTHQATCAVAVVFACSSWSLQLLAFAHWMKKKKDKNSMQSSDNRPFSL